MTHLVGKSWSYSSWYSHQRLVNHHTLLTSIPIPLINSNFLLCRVPPTVFPTERRLTHYMLLSGSQRLSSGWDMLKISVKGLELSFSLHYQELKEPLTLTTYLVSSLVFLSPWQPHWRHLIGQFSCVLMLFLSSPKSHCVVWWLRPWCPVCSGSHVQRTNRPLQSSEFGSTF